MQRLQRLSFVLPAISAPLHLPVINQVKEYRFSANDLTIAPSINTFSGRDHSDYTTTQLLSI